MFGFDPGDIDDVAPTNATCLSEYSAVEIKRIVVGPRGTIAPMFCQWDGTCGDGGFCGKLGCCQLCDKDEAIKKHMLNKTFQATLGGKILVGSDA